MRRKRNRTQSRPVPEPFLMPCPFCGGSAKQHRTERSLKGVKCEGCDVTKDTVSAWNQRSTTSTISRTMYDLGLQKAMEGES